MSNPFSPRRLGRSIAALIIGVAAGIIVTVLTDVVLHQIRLFPPWDQRVPDRLLLLATAYRTVYSIAASYLIARLAPYLPMQHALVGGALGLAASTAGMIATWNAGPAYEPHWYPIALIVLALPCAWAGGKIRTEQMQSRHSFSTQSATG